MHLFFLKTSYCVKDAKNTKEEKEHENVYLSVKSAPVFNSIDTLTFFKDKNLPLL